MTNVSLQKQDFKLLLNVIEICQQRGAFRVKEMMTVAKLYDRLQKCLEEQENKKCKECSRKYKGDETVLKDYFYEDDTDGGMLCDMLPKLPLSLPTILEEEEPADSPPPSTPRVSTQNPNPNSNPKLFSHSLE
jgi:hypothetical protein